MRANAKMHLVSLPSPTLINMWMAQYRVPAVGIAVIAGDNLMAQVYGELSKGIPAPPNTVWGSPAIASMLNSLTGNINSTDSSLLLSGAFTELQMTDTFFGDPIAVLNRMARPHNNREGIYVFKPQNISRYLYTTVTDVGKFIININNQGRVLTKLQSTKRAILWQTMAVLPGNGAVLINRAAGNGASHAVVLFPKSKQAVVIFTNSDNGNKVEDRIIESWKIDVGASANSPMPVFVR